MERDHSPTPAQRAMNAGLEVHHADRREPASYPAAGPHAKPDLTNEDATPGCGLLPEVGSEDGNMQPSS